MIKILRFYLLISLIVLSNNVFALKRYFTWIDPNTNLRCRIDVNVHELLKENGSGIWENKGKVNLNPSIFNHIPAYIDNDFFIYENGERIRITIQGTGQVYDFFPSRNELIRVDKTFHSGYNFGANLFTRKGELYSIGGEGFWNYSPIITYFDERVQEWEIHRPKNKGPVPIVSGYQGYNSKLDVFYSGGSLFGNYLEDEKKDYLNDLFVFDFKQNEWSYLGKINPELPFKKSRDISWTGEYFFHFSDGEVYIINPEKNEVYLYKNKTDSYKWGYDQFVNKDTLVIFRGINNGPIVKLSISEMTKNSTYWGEFYTNGINSYWYYMGLLILTIPLFFYYRKKSKNNNGIDFVFSDLEKKLLLKLIQLKPEDHLTTNDINDILETNNKTQENQRRIRFNVISEINKKIENSFGVKDGIERTSLPEDKRLTVYKLNQEVINKIENLLQ